MGIKEKSGLELWLDIKGYEGLYMISNTGKVKSFPRYKSHKLEIILSLGHVDGYKTCVLRKNKTSKSVRVHRLVAAAFIPNPKNKPFVNHINGKRDDNRVENLEWVTPAENIYHCRLALGSSPGRKRSPILCITTGELFLSIQEAGRILRIPAGNIHKNLTGKRNHAGGYVFKRVKE